MQGLRDVDGDVMIVSVVKELALQCSLVNILLAVLVRLKVFDFSEF